MIKIAHTIHLMSPHTSGPFCSNAMLNSDILTAEPPPHNRDVKNLCLMCKIMYDKNLDDERAKSHESWNNRSSQEIFHDKLENIAHWGEDNMGAILDVLLLFCTCGLIIPAKYCAKLLLKAGI